MYYRLFAALFLSAAFSQDARPRFDVASLKANPGCEGIPRAGNFSPSPARLEFPCIHLLNLLQSAFGTFGDGRTINPQPREMKGGPHLKTHFESKEAPAYTCPLRGAASRSSRFRTTRVRRSTSAIRAAARAGADSEDLRDHALRLGGKRRRRCPSWPSASPRGSTGPSSIRPASPGSSISTWNSRRTHHSRSGAPRSPDAAANPLAVTDQGPTLLVALLKQIGLSLSPGKGAVPVLVIDHVEKPSAD